ncbi:hypothetical protein AMJ47_02935 [Parcubacteria bacterium DG_72]|nr:MAG: hypothetical protein AMJ47_02935 [Parcubacteria bacterium DG_72]
MSEIIRARFVLELGRAIKSSIVSKIKNEAFMRGLDLTTEESKGILACTVRFELNGKQEAIDQMLTELQEYLRLVREALKKK